MATRPRAPRASQPSAAKKCSAGSRYGGMMAAGETTGSEVVTGPVRAVGVVGAVWCGWDGRRGRELAGRCSRWTRLRSARGASRLRSPNREPPALRARDERNISGSQIQVLGQLERLHLGVAGHHVAGDFRGVRLISSRCAPGSTRSSRKT